MRLWWYMAGAVSTGPITQSQLEHFFETGDVTHQTMVWTEGLEAWQEIGTIDEAALPLLPQELSPKSVVALIK